MMQNLEQIFTKQFRVLTLRCEMSRKKYLVVERNCLRIRWMNLLFILLVVSIKIKGKFSWVLCFWVRDIMMKMIWIISKIFAHLNASMNNASSFFSVRFFFDFIWKNTMNTFDQEFQFDSISSRLKILIKLVTIFRLTTVRKYFEINR